MPRLNAADLPALLRQAKEAGDALNEMAASVGNVNAALQTITSGLPVVGRAGKFVSETVSVAKGISSLPGEVQSLLTGGGGAAGAGGAAGGAGAAAAAGGAAGPIGLLVAGAIVAGKSLYELGENAVRTGMEFSKLANPATMERYNLAMLDAQAVVGERFVPVVEQATDFVRAIGDSLEEMLPAQQDVREAMIEAKPAIDEIRETLHEAAPLVKDLLISGLAEGVVVLRDFTQGLKGARMWLEHLGLLSPNRAAAQSSIGKAVGAVTIGSTEEIQRRIFEAGLKGPKQDPAERSAGLLEQMIQVIMGIQNSIIDLPGVWVTRFTTEFSAEKFGQNIGNAIKMSWPRWAGGQGI
jgi:hypothetical protein